MIELWNFDRLKLIDIFSDLQDTVILSTLQGYTGRAWADSKEQPRFGLIQGGDYLYIAGELEEGDAIKLISILLHLTELTSATVITNLEKVGELIQQWYKERCKLLVRYGIKKKMVPFDSIQLKKMVIALPEKYRLKKIDDSIYERVLSEHWSKGFVYNFSTKEDYSSFGIGYVILDGEDIVSGASSYTRYKEGIEVQIATREDYRKQGLVLVASSALILDCIDQGLYPSWDAANLTSVHIAEKLGYEFDQPYLSYYIKANN